MSLKRVNILQEDDCHVQKVTKSKSIPEAETPDGMFKKYMDKDTTSVGVTGIEKGCLIRSRYKPKLKEHKDPNTDVSNGIKSVNVCLEVIHDHIPALRGPPVGHVTVNILIKTM